jgi:hypothetical protein
LPNLALHKRATQSSRSAVWSKGSTVDDDARNAVDGKPWKNYAFHTEEEEHPWWMVDLGANALIEFIRIFNRNDVPDVGLLRATPLLAEASQNGTEWEPLFTTQPGQLFGGYTGGRPLVWKAPAAIAGRFVRLLVPRRTVLHLAEVEIYGTIRNLTNQ